MDHKESDAYKNYKGQQFFKPIINDAIMQKPAVESVSNGLVEKVRKELLAMEQSVVEQAISNFTGRKPNEEDFKKCKRMFNYGVNDTYLLEYAGYKLGYVKVNYGRFNNVLNYENNKIGIEFTPI